MFGGFGQPNQQQSFTFGASTNVSMMPIEVPLLNSINARLVNIRPRSPQHHSAFAQVQLLMQPNLKLLQMRLHLLKLRLRLARWDSDLIMLHL